MAKNLPLYKLKTCLWDLFNNEAIMVENTWNVSMRLMLDIPRKTHRYLIEPLSDTTHIKTIIINRFLRFLEQIQKSSKCASRHLLNSILHDARSTTVLEIYYGRGYSQLQYLDIKSTSQIQYLDIKSRSQIQYL